MYLCPVNNLFIEKKKPIELLLGEKGMAFSIPEGLGDFKIKLKLCQLQKMVTIELG